VKSVGVMDNHWIYNEIYAVRAIASTDRMTTDYFPFRPEFLGGAARHASIRCRGSIR
jgi:GMP synthase PP-ATPase subunit